MPSLEFFTVSFLLYLTLFLKVDRWFLHMLFPNSNHKYSSNYAQRSAPLMGSPVQSRPSPLAQDQNCSVIKLFANLRLHWSPDNPFVKSLHSNRNCQNSFSAGPFGIHYVHLILRSNSNLVVISIFLKYSTFRSHMTLITTDTSWLNALIRWNFLLTIFLLDEFRIELWMTRISASYLSQVLLPYSIS